MTDAQTGDRKGNNMTDAQTGDRKGNNMTDAQTGDRKGKSTEYHIMTMKQLIQIN